MRTGRGQRGISGTPTAHTATRPPTSVASHPRLAFARFTQQPPASHEALLLVRAGTAAPPSISDQHTQEIPASHPPAVGAYTPFSQTFTATSLLPHFRAIPTRGGPVRGSLAPRRDVAPDRTHTLRIRTRTHRHTPEGQDTHTPSVTTASRTAGHMLRSELLVLHKGDEKRRRDVDPLDPQESGTVCIHDGESPISLKWGHASRMVSLH